MLVGSVKLIEILNTNNVKWNKYIKKMPLELQDIYYTSEYYSMYELNGDGIGKLFVYCDNSKLALYPFMLREICGYNFKEKYYDIETAYGYGGPILNCFDAEFIRNFEKNFIQYCKKNNIIAEFIRFHPLIKNYNIFSNNIEVLYNRKTVYIDLNRKIDEIWENSISSKNRNMIRKAEKNELYVEKSADIESFKEIYNLTMNKVGADDYYYFKDDYYRVVNKLNNFILLNVIKEKKVIASAIFMGYEEYFHYHLAGSLKEYLKYGPNNFLLWKAISYAQKNGYKKMHFGGGRGEGLHDLLFKFKSSFSSKYADFYIGKRIHNNEVYNYLIDKWEQKHNKKAKILLQYRAK